MKKGLRFLVGPLMLGLALAHAPNAAAQQRDVDFDWILNTVDTLIGNLAEGFSFPLAGVDNDANGISDDDALAAFSVILRGGGREGTGISAANVTQLRADYATNRVAALNDMQITGLDCFFVGLAGFPCRVIEILDEPDVLGPVVGPVVGELLLDLIAGYATIGDNPATFNAVNDFLDAVLEALKGSLDPTIAGFINENIKNQLKIQPGNYQRWGASPSAAPRRNAFGAAGNLDNLADATTNLVEYSAASGNREAWLTGMGMIPPVRIVTQPAATSVQDGGTLNLTVTWVGGTPPFTVQWEDASDFADDQNTTNYGLSVLTSPQNIGATTTATYSVPVTLADDGLAPWLRITDAVTVYNALPVVAAPAHPPYPATRPGGQFEYDGFGGRSSVPAVVTVTPAPITAGVSPAGPVNLVVGQNLNLTAIPGGGVPPYSYEWIYGTTAGNMTPIFPAQIGFELNIGNVQLANAGFYAVRVTADDGLGAKALQTVESAPVQVNVVSPPITSSATVTGPLSIQVTFSQNMNTGAGFNGAGNPANYLVSGPGQGSLTAQPTSASASGTTATLTWASGEMNIAGAITVTVNAAVESAGGVPMGTPRVVSTNNNGQGIQPQPVITPDQGNPTNANPITFSVNFGETVRNFVSADVDVTGGTAVVTPPGNAQNFTITVTPSGSQGTVSVAIPAGVADDFAGNPGNPNLAAGPVSRNYDYVAPAPVVSTAVADPTNANPIPFAVDFGETVNGFDLISIAVVNGTASNIAPVGSASQYTFDVTPTGDGLVEVSVSGAGITDGAGNVSGNSNTDSVTYDGTAPQPVISTTASDPTDTAPIPFTVDFGEPMTGVINTDIVVTGGSRSGFTPLGNGVFTFNVTPAGNGTVLVDVPSAAGTDAAGNASLAAAQFSIEFFSPRPTVSLSSSAGGSGDLTNVNPIPIAVQFSTGVTGFDPVGEPGDVTIVNGTLDNFQDAGNGTNYSFDVIPSSPVTMVTVTVNENVADDGVNGNFDASFELDYDGEAPTVLLSSTTEPSPSNAETVTFTIQFTEPVSGFTLASIGLVVPMGGTVTASSLTDLGNGDVYTLVLTDITGDGSLEFLVNPGTIQDAAGNLFASQYFSNAAIEIDNTAPVITLIDPLPDTVDCGAGYTDPGATAEDAPFGDVTADIVVTDAGPVPFSPPGDYTITYEVTDEAGNTAILVRTITVTDNCPLQVTTNGAFVELDAGLSHTFEVTATGNLGALSYQWYKDDGNKALDLISGETSNTLELTDLTVGDSGDYLCVVSDQVVSVNSPIMTLNVLSGVPVAGIPALGGLALVLGAVGALVLRRRK